ncbi:uncharacterized protein [Amphiura filiformis]|uniref:uncharacterized protein n=1 Tax=Amphiura filiformis TaxID=82378 RepID=UPI003B2112CE
MFDRLAELYDTHNFHLKPSRIYACEGISLRVERWEADETKNIDVEMLVAANAVGFHILPPCVVYSNEEGDGIPDFLGLPEAGFVVSDKKKLTAPIVAEWFRSVFLHYLLPRTAEDPVALVLHGHHDWFSPELLQMAEKEHVHLVPVCPQIRFWTNPIQSILLKLRDAYVDSMRSYKMSQIGKVQDPFEVEAFPVPLLTLFSEHFTMCRVQEAFKSAGLFPLKPEQVQLPKEEPVRKSKSKKKAKGTKTNAKESEEVANVSNQKTKSDGLESLVVQSSKSGESILLKVCSEVVLDSDGASTSNGDGKTPAISLLESMQKSLSANKEPNLDMKASSSNDTVPIITPVKNPTAIAVSTSSATSTSTSKSDPVTFTLHSQDASTPEPKQDSHFNTEVLNSIVVVKKQNEDRRSYVMLKKMTSTRPKTTGIPTASTQPKMTDMPTTSTAASSAVTMAVPTTPSSSVQQTTAIPTLSPPSNNPPQPSATQPIPVKITKADEDATSFPSHDVSLGVATSSTPVSSNSAPGSTSNALLTTDVTMVTATSASSSTDAVESDSDDNDSDLDISEVDVEPSNTASILKQPKPVLTTPSTSILDHIQSVIAKNTDILSSLDIKKSKTSRKANKAASKSAVSTIKPSVSEPRKAPSQTTVPTTVARTSAAPIIAVNKPSGSEPQMAPSQTTIPTVPISVIAAKLQQHVLSQRRKPNPSVRVAQSHQSATSATISAPFKQQSTITAGGRNTVPSQGSAIISSTLVPSASGGALPSVAVTPISLQQQPQVSKSQAQLTKSEAATLSKIAKAFNADVADIILAVKNQQKTLASQRRPSEKTSGSQPSSNQARIAPAPATPAVPLVAPVVTVYNPLQQAQGAPILVSGGRCSQLCSSNPLYFLCPKQLWE